MRINSLSLENYRNIIRCDLTPGEGVNLIVGDNAQGKTNLMEAIWLLTGEKTFRYGREHDILRLDMDRETQRTRVRWHRSARPCGSTTSPTAPS